MSDKEKQDWCKALEILRKSAAEKLKSAEQDLGQIDKIMAMLEEPKPMGE